MICPELKAPPRAGGSNTEGPLSGLDVMGLSQGPVWSVGPPGTSQRLVEKRLGGFLALREMPFIVADKLKAVGTIHVRSNLSTAAN